MESEQAARGQQREGRSEQGTWVTVAHINGSRVGRLAPARAARRGRRQREHAHGIRGGAACCACVNIAGRGGGRAIRCARRARPASPPRASPAPARVGVPAGRSAARPSGPRAWRGGAQAAAAVTAASLEVAVDGGGDGGGEAAGEAGGAGGGRRRRAVAARRLLLLLQEPGGQQHHVHRHLRVYKARGEHRSRVRRSGGAWAARACGLPAQRRAAQWRAAARPAATGCAAGACCSSCLALPQRTLTFRGAPQMETKREPGLLEASATPILQRSTCGGAANDGGSSKRQAVSAGTGDEARSWPAQAPPQARHNNGPRRSQAAERQGGGPAAGRTSCRFLMCEPEGPSSAPTRRSGISMMRKHTEVSSRVPAAYFSSWQTRAATSATAAAMCSGPGAR